MAAPALALSLAARWGRRIIPWLILGLVAMTLMVLFSGDDPPAPCYTSAGVGPGVIPAAATALGLDAAQARVVGAVIDTGRQLGVSDQGIVIALATARQESQYRVYANDGLGSDLASDQQDVAQSLALPHDAVGTDHGSVGPFQQQFPWWGTLAELMDPATSARLFYTALVAAVPGWETMPVTQAADAVQRSAYPDAYADDEAPARAILAAWTGTTTATGGEPGPVVPGTTVPCLTIGAAAPGTVQFPLPASAGAVDNQNWHQQSAWWSTWHTGNDWSVACGTPVYAVHNGTVIVDAAQAGWAGGNFVKISTGPASLTTWYAHMATLTVSAGQTVTAGQQIGTVGSEGNSSGCHLHLEVHLTNGSIYAEDNVDPSAWLAANVGSTIGGPAAAATGPRVATFNVLGHDHTSGPGARPGWAGSAERMRGAVALLDSAGVELVALQEFQPEQEAAFEALTRGAWDHWPKSGGKAGAANQVAWRTDKWTLVRGKTIGIPYFGGQKVQMPYVLLTNTAGQKVWMTSFHNPADTRGPAARWRTEALTAEAELAAELAADGTPVIIAGDLNDRAAAYCGITAVNRALAAANGGTPGPPCQPPAPMEIDWLMGTNTTFSGYTADPTPQTQRVSDHPLISAAITLP